MFPPFVGEDFTIFVYEGEIRGHKIELHEVGYYFLSKEPGLHLWPLTRDSWDQPYLKSERYHIVSKAYSLVKSRSLQPFEGVWAGALDKLEATLCPSGGAILITKGSKSSWDHESFGCWGWYRLSGGTNEKWRAADFDALFGKPKAQPAKVARNP